MYSSYIPYILLVRSATHPMLSMGQQFNLLAPSQVPDLTDVWESPLFSPKHIASSLLCALRCFKEIQKWKRKAEWIWLYPVLSETAQTKLQSPISIQKFSYSYISFQDPRSQPLPIWNNEYLELIQNHYWVKKMTILSEEVLIAFVGYTPIIY